MSTVKLGRFARFPGLWAAALGLMIASPSVRADDPPKADAPKIAPEADAVLRRMADFYAKHRSFRVDDARTVEIGIVPLKQTITVAFERPNRMAYRPQRGLFAANSGYQLVCDGRTLTVEVFGRGMYVQVPAPPTAAALAEQQPLISSTIEAVMAGGNVLTNLMVDDPYAALKEEIETASYVGLEGDEGTRTHHLRLTQEAARMDFWVDAEGDPLLRRATLKMGKEDNERGPSMQIIQYFKHWKFDTDEAALFTYQPPPKYKKVDSIAEASGFDPNKAGHGDAPSPLIGRPAPPVKLAASGGGTFDLAEHRGRVVMLDFWATWCGPCVKELPILAEVAQEYREKGVVFYGINLREGEDKVAEFQRKQGVRLLGFPVAHDADGAVAAAYGADAIPTTVLIDREGIVRVVHVGFDPKIRGKLTAELDALLAGRAPGEVAPPVAAPKEAEGAAEGPGAATGKPR